MGLVSPVEYHQDMSELARPRLRWFQFRLRTLLIGVTLFALIPCGYVGWQAKIVRER